MFFDTETTGLNCNYCKIIELAMFTLENGEITEEYDKFIKINEKLPHGITQITGITEDMLQNEGVDEKIIAQDLKERLTPNTLMVAHNAQFDLSFIHSLLKRHYPNEADEIVANLNWLDTVTVFKDRKKYPHKLIDAVHYYGIEEVNFHRAIDDTKALFEVTKALKRERNDLAEYINIFGYNPKYGVGRPVFPFIEYKAQYYCYSIRPSDEILPKK
ncbi:PolC-type DNA polymerase III [uncultured Methanobrevibacter sp.]|uniref:3'-5' exonuclease n=1 Tax=uncultured Methanobrevibacter sp. TaxID=253161 RepID=UPI0025CC5178|nr:3'-5' exonuclease [uncultured Methanobrevibacter sp.]